MIHDLVEHGEVQRPYMGITTQSLTDIASYHWTETLKLPGDVKQGVVVMSVQSLSPADQSGLQKYDVIVQLDGIDIENVLTLRKYIFNKKKIGDTLEVSFYRGGLLQTVELSLDKVLKNE